MCLTLQLCFAQCLESSKCPMNMYRWKNKCMEWTSWRNRKRRRWERRSISHVTSSRLLLFSGSVVSDSLWPHGLQHAGLPCPLPSPDAIQPSHSLSPPSPPALNLSHSHIRVFSNESALLIRWPKCWSFSFNISPFSEHPGLISFRMDWLDLLAVQGTLKSLLQQHSSKASMFRHSAFFVFELLHPYMTTGKTIALTRRDLCCQSNVSAF